MDIIKKGESKEPLNLTVPKSEQTENDNKVFYNYQK